MSKEDITTIQVSKNVREELKKLGSMGETYDDVIKRLIEKVKECEKHDS
jgi:predicted CopG family antitoxin